MRDDPTWIRRVPMEAPADLVVHAALRHRRKRAREDFLEAFLSRPVVAGHDPFHRPWVRELLLAGDAAVYGIELAAKRVEALLQHRLVHGAFFHQGDAALGEGSMEGFRLFQRVRPVRAVGVRHREEHTAEARPPVPVLRWQVRAPVETLAVRREERSERPAALARHRADGLLEARVDVRPLVPVHLDRDEVLVDDGREIGVLVRFAVDYVAPVAPGGPDVEQDRAIEFFRAAEGVLASRVPLDWLRSEERRVGKECRSRWSPY